MERRCAGSSPSTDWIFLLRNRSEVCTEEVRSMLSVTDAFRITRSSEGNARHISK